MEVNRGQSGPSGSLRKTRRNRCAFRSDSNDRRRPAECACARARIRASAHEKAPDSVTTTSPVCGKNRPVKNARSDALFFALKPACPDGFDVKAWGRQPFRFSGEKKARSRQPFHFPGIVCAASGDAGKKRPEPHAPAHLLSFSLSFLFFSLFLPGPFISGRFRALDHSRSLMI